MIKKPELLAPAGNLEVLQTAIRFGADAVYIGGGAFSLRAKARNFSLAEMRTGVDFAHRHGGKVYVAANILARDDDTSAAYAYFHELNEIRPDALIIADPGLFTSAREICPDIDIHISTQAGSANSLTFRFWHGQGAKRVIAARELSLAEIAAIRRNTPAELGIECFVHGAMCISYSGRCLLSNYFTGRDANRGACCQPCRWQYAVVEESRPGLYLPLAEDERGTYIFNACDLSMIDHLPELIAAGIDSFKIEGRMKGELYVAAVTRAYRRAIDDFFDGEDVYRGNGEWYRREIRSCTYRRHSTGFYFGRPDEDAQIYDSAAHMGEAVYLGTVMAVDSVRGARLTQKNKFAVGDAIVIMKPDGDDVKATVTAITDVDGGMPMDEAPHPRQDLYVALTATPEPGDVLRSRLAE